MWFLSTFSNISGGIYLKNCFFYCFKVYRFCWFRKRLLPTVINLKNLVASTNSFISSFDDFIVSKYINNQSSCEVHLNVQSKQLTQICKTTDLLPKESQYLQRINCLKNIWPPEPFGFYLINRADNFAHFWWIPLYIRFVHIRYARIFAHVLEQKNIDYTTYFV